MEKYRKVLIGATIFTVLYLGILLLIMNGVFLPVVKKINGIEEKGQTFEELTIPENVKVVGIGEASHGNAEFQTAKLLMLRKLVETGKCHSIAFEMSPGEAAEINDAIHSEDVDINELMGRSDYPLYDTQQMVELVTWMREYNKGKTVEDSLMFYGVDMQGYSRDFSYIEMFAKNHTELFTDDEIALLDQMVNDENYDISSQQEFIETLVQRLEAYADTADEEAGQSDKYNYKYASLVAQIALQGLNAPDFDQDASEYSQYRDKNMAENLKCFYDIEEERGYSQILITAHNGHTMKGKQEGYNAMAMGGFIDEIFNGSYFSVGTAYYNACVNIHVSGTFDDNYLRDDFTFCSDDILAYQAKYFDGGFYCLSFDEITDKDSELYRRINKPGFMGLVGEGYSSMAGIQKTDRVKLVQGDRFDAVMYYYDVTPIRVLNY